MKEKETQAPDFYPGADINAADDNKADTRLEKERTETLNNNPRNTDEKNM